MNFKKFINFSIATIMISAASSCSSSPDEVTEVNIGTTADKAEIMHESTPYVTLGTVTTDGTIFDIINTSSSVEKETLIVTTLDSAETVSEDEEVEETTLEENEEVVEETTLETEEEVVSEITEGLDLDETLEEKDSQPIYETVETVPSLTPTAVTNSLVNFRTEPRTDSDIIEVLSNNSLLYILDDMKEEKGFYHVVSNGYVGFVDKNLVSINKVKLYASEDTKLNIGEESYLLKEGAYITLIKTAGGEYVDTNLNVASNADTLVSYKEYMKGKMDSAQFELVTSFSTNYSLEKLYEGKAFNINHCCDNYINGTIVAKGETFDWFRDVGDTGYNEGYVLANVFSGGKTIKGYGGGVCQVSSTIYNCVLNLGLKVIERHAHGMPVYYVDYYAGKDASVSDTSGGFNFVWQNTEDYDIYIKAYTYVDESKPLSQQGVLEVEFYKIII